MRNSKGSLMRPDPLPHSASHPVVTPLSPSVVYASETPDALDDQYEGRVHGYTYSREGHPNADVVAKRLDAMEGMSGGVVTGSGMAAVSAVLLGLTKTGDHVIGGNQLYGRSLRLMKEDLPRLGIETSLADPADIAAVRAAIRPETKMILVETVSNPTLAVADIDGLSALCKETGILLVVDNTFTTPRGFQPFDHGADIVIHSITKLLAGHSDVMLGYVVARDPALNERLSVFSVTTGMTPSPFDCWLAERGMLSFELRFERSQATAAALADHLAGMPGVKRVIYPTRKDHPDHDRAMDLLKGQGCNMVSFELEGGRAAANAFTRAADGLNFAPTLGDVGTTLSHPASSSHRALTPEERAGLGLSEGFFRVSVGLEDPAALLAVFSEAVAAAAAS
ncbi:MULTISPECIES: trans-sulfuration enzyme family protein [Rhodobacterales]|jgi:cystathionine gamma-synthase|uniref:Aminotransferase class I/II-fold pyridoxal phosphate-dependent enzyme n=1 Tax=Phaeobacter gallaeciensis TaxID=60890 RepID=A0A1B0ZLS9_9RHOB|nr:MULTISPECIES: aminotransferase class I/II-fold pyridoxal phosphate-dependent enzyme [Phaeobacter]MDF1773423.1 aminotransferase class I/II-fold pyridoxal phosphate-dependent enzyme [Pseudophaeobacter sp. bin_em_oilr2.035]MEE2634542.1 aminotransferase class I/II-fold pyridoxal phosphate-dependent enzyme [Pseudomonadota bacterium]ANP35106.1 cystathionine gamma-synthase [Phaeobacter gallaeciensis]MDE4063128.1 aminotransferase class I/II-fold pyridoxal phosphate-dependent enzyme [Phaeobacter gall